MDFRKEDAVDVEWEYAGNLLDFGYTLVLVDQRKNPVATATYSDFKLTSINVFRNGTHKKTKTGALDVFNYTFDEVARNLFLKELGISPVIFEEEYGSGIIRRLRRKWREYIQPHPGTETGLPQG